MIDATTPGEFDFAKFGKVRITERRLRQEEAVHPLVGCTGDIECIYGAYESWPSDLLYLTMLDGESVGKTIKVFAHRCEPITEAEEPAQ